MGFPDRIERTLELAHPPATVWAALTTAEGLAAWFGDEADIDLRPGGAGARVLGCARCDQENPCQPPTGSNRTVATV